MCSLCSALGSRGSPSLPTKVGAGGTTPPASSGYLSEGARTQNSSAVGCPRARLLHRKVFTPNSCHFEQFSEKQ